MFLTFIHLKNVAFPRSYVRKPPMAVWTEHTQKQRPDVCPEPPLSRAPQPHIRPAAAPKTPARFLDDYGWPYPAAVSSNPEEARSQILLPEFDELLHEKARVISGRFPFAEAEYRNLRSKDLTEEAEIAHFEKVFRIAARIASVPEVQEDPDYDTLLILTAWYSVRPEFEGFLSSYPKSLLCPLSHSAPPSALASLSTAKQNIFERRAPAYLRYLLCNK